MSRGNRLLGIVEVVEELEAFGPMLEVIVHADGVVTPDERILLDAYAALTAGSQSLAVRTQIGMSLLRGLAEPPERTQTLVADYWERYGPRPVQMAAA